MIIIFMFPELYSLVDIYWKKASCAPYFNNDKCWQLLFIGQNQFYAQTCEKDPGTRLSKDPVILQTVEAILVRSRITGYTAKN